MKIVCFGGGTGLPSLLSGLKKNPWIEATAIVSMFDSGGSSGVLRDRYGILPPGDIMRCMLALSEDEKTARKILLKRINHTVVPGHTGGNLLLYALESVYGSYPAAVDALGQILSIKGTVIPVSLEPSSLCARYEDGSEACNEVMVDEELKNGKVIATVSLQPSASAYAPAMEAIQKTDAICIGPGSFYTSVLPNFLPVGIKEAISSTKVPVIFIANLLTEGKGMESLDVSKMVAIIESHIGRPLTKVIVNSAMPGKELVERYAGEGKSILSVGDAAVLGDRLVSAPIWTDLEIARHDSGKLAQLVYALAGKII
jgi:uncharacterized cofD-like protein